MPGRYRQRARRVIEMLAKSPRPASAEPLRGWAGLYRLWLNGWRIIYRVDDDTAVLWIVGIRLKTGQETYLNLDLGEQ